MKKTILILSILFLSTSLLFSQTIESKIREFSKYEYPNDIEMQNYIYKQQILAYRFMLT